MYTLSATSSYHVSNPADTYIYDLAIVASGLASISSDNSLRLFDATNLDAGPVSEVKNVNADVTCMKVLGGETGNGGEGVVVCTAGRDGKSALWDPRTGKKIGEVVSEQNAPILSLACSHSYGLAAGTELTNHQATITIWDTRQLGDPVVKYVESHSDDVTELQFHPSRPQILLSGSTDGLVNIYNTTIADEEEALHQTVNHGHSIHHADFLNDTEIFALSHDEKFSMYELVTNPEEGVEEPAPVHLGDIRELLGGEYVANVMSRPGGGAVIGVGTHSRDTFELIQLTKNPSWQFVPDSRVSLHRAHGSEIVRSFCFLDSQKTVLSCGEDGQIKAWKGD